MNRTSYREEFDRLDRMHGDWAMHDGWFYCHCATAERMRFLFDRLNPKPPKTHRLAVLD